jgi:hypothetical protein
MRLHLCKSSRRFSISRLDPRRSRFLSADLLERRILPGVITPFTPRFTTNATGDITIVANTEMTAPASDPAAINAQNGVGSKINNNDFNMAFVDVDKDSSTFDSSSASLNLPTGATVLFAGLYWGGRNPNAALERQVKFATPTSSGYSTITGQVLGTSNTSNGDDYESFANVTSQVAVSWSAPQKLIHPKWESVVKLCPGGAHEEATERRRGGAIAPRG